MKNGKTTTRNEYQPVDLFDRSSKSLDIRINGFYPSNVLSNLYSNEFCFDGMICGSMEGALQSLKQKDIEKQRLICAMKGSEARKHNMKSWQTDQILWWKGEPIDRQSDEYQKLLQQLYLAMFNQCEQFRAALMSTRGIILIYSCGEDDPYKTTLTEDEFCRILTEIRDNYDKRDKVAKKEKRILVDTRDFTLEITALQKDATNGVEGEKIILGSETFPDWNSVFDYIETKKNER